MGTTASIFAKLVLDSSEYTKGLDKSKAAALDFTGITADAMTRSGAEFSKMETRVTELMNKYKSSTPANLEYAKAVTNIDYAFQKGTISSSEAARQLKKVQEQMQSSVSSMDKFKSGFQQITGFSLSTAGAMAAAGMALREVIQYTKQAIEANDAYVSSIVDMARFTGDNTDAMSRFVQVADDAFVSQESLNTALSIGAKKGLDVSVQGIKDLADQYNALATPQEKAKLLNDNFGRSGLEMGKLLELGSAGITKQMEAISKSLVVTDEIVKTTYAYKRSVDALNDSQDGLRYQIAQGSLPAFTDLNNAAADATTAIEESGAASKVASAGAWMLQGALTGVKVIFSGYTTEQEIAEQYIRDTTDAMNAQNGELELTEEQIKAAAEAVNTLAKAQLSITESVMSAETKFNEKYASLMEERIQLEADQATATGEKLDEINSDLAENTQAIQDNADEYELAKNKILLGYTEQLLAADGLTQEEVDFLLKKGQEWGIYSDTAVAEMQAVMAEAADLTNSLNGIPTTKELTIYINTVESYTRNAEAVAARNVTRHALGGTTIAGSTSMVNERGIPEIVSVGNKDYLTMGSQNGTVTPISNTSDANNTDTMMVNALMSVIASNQALPRKIAHEIKQLEKYNG